MGVLNPSEPNQVFGEWEVKDPALSQSSRQGRRTRSIQPETHFNVDSHSDWNSILHAWREFPFLNRLNRFLIQTHTERTRHVYVARPPLLIHNQRKYDYSLLLDSASLV